MKMDNCLLTLVLGLSMLGGCLARVVTVSPGPLIRVEGQPVSIRCDVNDYMGPHEQDFEWMMSKDGNVRRIKIISTFDTSYSHASLSKRVASGDISVVRLSDNEVELKIAEVKALDAGFYWCQTPSTDSVISGNYEAQVQLIVIPNTLKVSPQTPPPVVPEGSDITLSCNITWELTHPTYVSVTWLLKKGATSEEILTFGPQGGVVTGQKYAKRYADGGIRLVPGKIGSFNLVISRVTTSDEGIYECSGTEWTYENGGKWIKIVEKTKEMGTVAVTPTAPITVTLNAPNPKTIFSNNQAELECIITGRDNTIVSETKITWQIDEQNVNSNIMEMTIREGSQYRKISTLTRSRTEWQKVNRVRCSAISGNMTPVTQDLTVHKGDGSKPTVTVHIPPEEDIKGDSAVTLMCLISSPVQQDYYIAWSEDTERRTGIYTDGITFPPQKTQRGYTVINVYTTTKEKWNQGYVFYCNVWPAGSNESMIPRGVSKAISYSQEC
ncbi:immunoglobulin superfamily member 8-like [Thunnus albacares]|uniref:immunoglobulin superfamily member 8-like n=1 Tax=Thunnus albacares TaxID=8236 RepID=UPI001CF6E1B9|nr:immunoglobulin superfamily member 8-like [Thunnus albacares]